jgi:heptosyltransferase-2
MDSGNVPYGPVTGNETGPREDAGDEPARLAGVERLLVLSPNWLGDAVMALPAIADLRRAMPRGAITIAARPSVAPLFTLAPGVDAVVVLDGRRSIARDVGTIRDGRYEAAVLLPNSFRSALLVRRAGIPERWGYRTAFRRPLLTFAPAPPIEVHQAVYYQRLAAAIGAASGPLIPCLVVGDGERQAADAFLSNRGWNGKQPLVALAPGAAYGAAKRWPPESFSALASALVDDGVLPVIVGGAADTEACDAVVTGLRTGGAINLVGRTDLPTLAGVLSLCRGLVSNDSGAMHVASAIGIPVTALFGPTDEDATRPHGAGRCTVLTHAVWCRPCLLRECPLDHRCMRGIRVESALEAVRSGL